MTSKEKQDKYGAIMRGHAFGILEKVFGAEWVAVESAADRAMIAEDYLDAAHEDDCSVREYQRRIGRGNLASYIRTLNAGKGRAK